MFFRSPHLSPHLSPEPTRSPYRGASSDEECRGLRPRGRETAILSDADFDSHSDTGLDGGDEDEPDDFTSPSRRRARRRKPPRRPPRSAGMNWLVHFTYETAIIYLFNENSYLNPLFLRGYGPSPSVLELRCRSKENYCTITLIVLSN